MKKLFIVLFILCMVLLSVGCKKASNAQTSIQAIQEQTQGSIAIVDNSVVDAHDYEAFLEEYQIKAGELEVRLANITVMERQLVEQMLDENASPEVIENYMNQYEECIYLRNFYISQFHAWVNLVLSPNPQE